MALKHRVDLLGEPFRPRAENAEYFLRFRGSATASGSGTASHFTRAKRVAYAIVDVVTRYWIGYLLTTEQTPTQAQLLFARALGGPGAARARRAPARSRPG